jgi:hypothetical protein
MSTLSQLLGAPKSSLVGMKVGEYITCRYTASTSGAAGFFSELGTCTAPEIPLTGTATPNGLLNFIKADSGLLISDRVVQHTVSWDTLRNSGFIEGIIPFSDITDQSYLIDDGHFSTRNGAFDNVTGAQGSNNCWQADLADGKGWVGQLFPTARAIKQYSISPSSDNASTAPTSWTFEGSNDGVTWDVLDTRSGITWAVGVAQYFSINGNSSYTRYRVNGVTGSSSYLTIGEIQMSEIDYLIRSLSGGILYTDINGNPSSTANDQTLFPSHNEWDRYVANSNLGGKITPGDDAIWNTNRFFSFCKDTSHSWTLTNKLGATSSMNNTLRTQRAGLGNTNASLYGSFGNGASTTADTIRGFRPVLEYIEPDGSSKQSNLWY